jgi:hypothetical protein
MVTKAIWSDLDKDGHKELVVTGLWMAPRIFSFKNGQVAEINTNLGNLHGWWYALGAGDLDGDGDTDLVLGNIGENFYLNPDSANPVKLWMNDFDDNSTVDKVLTRTVAGRDVPVFLKRDMQDQLPVLKKQSLKHDDFAKKSIQELFAGPALKKSLIKQFNYSSSIVAINNGGGQFTIRKMPAQLQLSSVNAITLQDVNKDGNPDIITGGNQFGFLPQFERLDASFGDILLNDGKGNFTVTDSRRNGMHVTGEVRDLKLINYANSSNLLFLRNNDLPVMYKINTK